MDNEGILESEAAKLSEKISVQLLFELIMSKPSLVKDEPCQ